jgi:hypothetical protein
MIKDQQTKCFFCNKDAQYFDVVLNNKDYIVADVCNDHVSIEYVS